MGRICHHLLIGGAQAPRSPTTPKTMALSQFFSDHPLKHSPIHLDSTVLQLQE